MMLFKNISATLCLRKFSRCSVACYVRKFCSQGEKHHAAADIANLSDSLEEEMKAMKQQQLHTSKASILRVPTKLRKTDSGAYDPHFISIGPFHHGLPHLQDSERLKLDSLNRVVGAKDELDNMLSVLDAMEPQARGSYSEDVKLSRNEFVRMMLLDGCFIVGLFRDFNQKSFASSSCLSKRWMLPVIRRDLILLENQLPMVVLQKIFDEIMRSKSSLEEETSLVELALRFFDPLMPRKEFLLKQSIASVASTPHKNFNHLLHVFHSSISLGNVARGKEPHMYGSVTELREEGIKVRVLGNSQPLEVRFNRGKLRMPSLHIDNHTSCFFRNILAYEQCHHECNPDMTTYLFFLDKLINSAEDVGLLHYEDVILHTLGSNKQVANLINNLCIEFEHDGQDSYLYEVVEKINKFSDQTLIQAKTRLKHDYFSNFWVSISTLAAVLLIYLTLLQASCEVIKLQDKKGLWETLNLFLLHPIEGFKKVVIFIVERVKNVERFTYPNDLITPGDPFHLIEFAHEHCLQTQSLCMLISVV